MIVRNFCHSVVDMCFLFFFHLLVFFLTKMADNDTFLFNVKGFRGHLFVL